MSGARISDKRIAELKYDEAVVNSQANRDKVPKMPTIVRFSCVCCGGIVINQDKDHRANGHLKR